MDSRPDQPLLRAESMYGCAISHRLARVWTWLLSSRPSALRTGLIRIHSATTVRGRRVRLILLTEKKVSPRRKNQGLRKRQVASYFTLPYNMRDDVYGT